MRRKILQWMKFLLRYSSNSRKLSRQKFHNELACVFTAHYASKNADWNQQQLTDGGILANRNSANHSYFFLSKHKKVQILAFLHVICDCIMPSSLLPPLLLIFFCCGLKAGSHAAKSGRGRNLFPLILRSARCSFAPFQKMYRNDCSYVWAEALSGMVFASAQGLYGILWKWP